MTNLRILFVEDLENDALLLLRELQNGGYKDVQWERVETAPDIQSALMRQPWDLILCDYALPRMNPIQALELLKKNNMDIPLIVVSGTIAEEDAVSLLKAGGHDLILKSNLARLVPAIQRELKEAEIRRNHKRADNNLRVSELRFRSTLENMMEGCQIIGFNWCYLFLNDAAVVHSQKTRDELIGYTMMECYPGIEDSALFASLQRCMTERSSHHLINEFVFPNGTQGWFELRIQPAPEGIFILSTDITKQKQAELEIHQLNAALEEKVALRTVELGNANDRLNQLLLFDELTGLYNRRGFMLLAEEQLLLARRTKCNLLVFYADLDELKTINDQFGHAAGDEAIITVAYALRATFRSSDVKARLSGDEFIVLAVEADDHHAPALLKRLHERLNVNKQTISVGVVSCDAQSEIPIQELMKQADEAMYIEKRKKPGRSRTVTH